MNSHPYDPSCPHCRPTIVHLMTGQVMPRTDPLMVKIDAMWDVAPLAERAAFIRVTDENSRDPDDMALATAITERIMVLTREDPRA